MVSLFLLQLLKCCLSFPFRPSCFQSIFSRRHSAYRVIDFSSLCGRQDPLLIAFCSQLTVISRLFSFVALTSKMFFYRSTHVNCSATFKESQSDVSIPLEIYWFC